MALMTDLPYEALRQILSYLNHLRLRPGKAIMANTALFTSHSRDRSLFEALCVCRQWHLIALAVFFNEDSSKWSLEKYETRLKRILLADSLPCRFAAVRMAGGKRRRSFCWLGLKPEEVQQDGKETANIRALLMESWFLSDEKEQIQKGNNGQVKSKMSWRGRSLRRTLRRSFSSSKS